MSCFNARTYCWGLSLIQT